MRSLIAADLSVGGNVSSRLPADNARLHRGHSCYRHLRDEPLVRGCIRHRSKISRRQGTALLAGRNTHILGQPFAAGQTDPLEKVLDPAGNACPVATRNGGRVFADVFRSSHFRSEEFSQMFFVHRTFDLLDLTCNTCGILLLGWLAVPVASWMGIGLSR